MTTPTFRLQGARALIVAAAMCFAGCGSDQPVGLDGHFDSLKLASSGGIPWPRNTGDECNSSHANSVSVAAATSSIAWDACEYDSTVGHMTLAQGGRTLESAELESVRQALRELRVGNDGSCGADKAMVTLDVESGAASGRYVDDFYGCEPPIEGRTFVKNIDSLGYVLWNLAQ
jgi:hypothetical protein